MFEPEVFRKQIFCIELSTCDIVLTFRRPHGDSTPEELCPLTPLFTALGWTVRNWSVFYKFISLMPDDSLERKGSSENRNAVWKAYN